MNFIVTSTGNIQLKIDPAIVLASRAYVDAAILEVLPANKTAGEFTRVKVNNRGVVVSGDNPDTLAKMGITDTYTKAQVDAMIAEASALPVGTMVGFPVNKVPPGFLEINGSVKSIAAYPDLAAFLGAAFNRGDEGAGNFRLPESRGEFLRGWDHGRGVNVGRGIGTYELDELKSHSHRDLFFIGGGAGGTPSPSSTYAKAYNSAGSYSFDGTGAGAGLTTSPTGGAETRPRNLAVMWCIKAWNAPINQGNIDIAALAVLAGQATESNQGTAKVATQAIVDLGADDATFVTPKKLLFGIEVLLSATIGYIRFPSWCKRFTIAWGAGLNNTPTTFPIGFTSAPRIAGMPSSASPTTVSYSALSATSVTLQTTAGSSTSYLAIGFS